MWARLQTAEDVAPLTDFCSLGTCRKERTRLRLGNRMYVVATPTNLPGVCVQLRLIRKAKALFGWK